jgi:SOS-response transcriptional repressor LexA
MKNSNYQKQIRLILKALDVTQSGLASKLGLSQSVISEFAGGVREPSKEFLLGLPKLGISLDWFLSGEGEMLLSVKKEKKHPLIAELEVIVDQRLENIEVQIAEIKAGTKKLDLNDPDFDQKLEKFESRMAKIEDHLKRMGSFSPEKPESGLYVLEPEPIYDAEYEKTAFMDNIAAGPPIQQSEDLSNFIDVPKRFIKTKPEDYYAARIRGESMTAAGIPDGCTVLIRRSDVPRDGAIQVVRCGGKSTLKRMREGEDHTWTLHYEDNSERLIPIGKDEEYQVQGDFVAVLLEDK